jgi:hypothetical protein
VTIEESIKKTKKYAAVFDFDLTIPELHHWLITPKPVSQKVVHKNQRNTPINKTKKRLHRQKLSTLKLAIATNFAIALNQIPTIRMVAITGSLAMRNVKENHDIDIMIITTKNSLWISICTNLWLDQKALAIPTDRRNLYTAHEVLQLEPILDKDMTYHRFIKKNAWVKKHLANAYWSTLNNQDLVNNKGKTKKFTTLINNLISLANKIAFSIQYLYMKPKLTNELVTINQAYFHPRDLSKKIDSAVK